jgi:hypothetical protein
MLLTRDDAWSWIVLASVTLFNLALLVVAVGPMQRRANRVSGLPQHPLTGERFVIF